MNELTNAMTVAVAKVIKDAAAKEASGKLVAGEYPVDFTVSIKGSLKKGDDYESEIVAKADFALLFAVALSKLNGVTAESIVRDSLSFDPALVDGLKAHAAEAVAKIKETTKTTCNGKITTKLVVEVV